MPQILIAHQSSIPHYRVPFYNALHEALPEGWGFQVVFDPSEPVRKRFFSEPVDPDRFRFATLPVRTISVRVGGRRVSYQPFLARARRFDVLVVEHALNNLAYPLSPLARMRGVRMLYWGAGRDRREQSPTRFRRLGEALKRWLARRADGYLAYSDGVRDFVIGNGVAPARVTVLNNTIDILDQRAAFDALRPRRRELRDALGVGVRPTMLFVGRPTRAKRIDFLLEAFAELRRDRPDARLLIVGAGSDALSDTQAGVQGFGTIVDREALARIFVASDLFVNPGGVGLAAVQAFCYDLPVVTVVNTVATAEFDYLNPENSVVLPIGTDARSYAGALAEVIGDAGRLERLRAGVWPSVSHLTVQSMAERFLDGVRRARPRGSGAPPG